MVPGVGCAGSLTGHDPLARTSLVRPEGLTR